jgi:hypothetical protein
VIIVFQDIPPEADKVDLRICGLANNLLRVGETTLHFLVG